MVVLLGIAAWFGLFKLGVFGGGTAARTNAAAAAAQTKEVQFVSFVLDDVQAQLERAVRCRAKASAIRSRSWCSFAARTKPAAGRAAPMAGPFYCPSDQRVYIDLELLR